MPFDGPNVTEVLPLGRFQYHSYFFHQRALTALGLAYLQEVIAYQENAFTHQGSLEMAIDREGAL